MRIKFTVDDGTAVVSGVMNKDITEKILGKTLEECKKMDENALAEEMNNLLFARRINITGNALGDSYGTTLIVKDMEFVDINIKEESAKFTQELEELQ